MFVSTLIFSVLALFGQSHPTCPPGNLADQTTASFAARQFLREGSTPAKLFVGPQAQEEFAQKIEELQKSLKQALTVNGARQRFGKPSEHVLEGRTIVLHYGPDGTWIEVSFDHTMSVLNVFMQKGQIRKTAIGSIIMTPHSRGVIFVAYQTSRMRY